MINVMRAYLQTEGKIDYRECQVVYYTYCMFDTPNRFKVNVNVHVQSPKKQYKKTLNTDSSFDSESDAIEYGIEQGKKYIDQTYEAGKISFIKTEEKVRVRNSTAPTNTTPTSTAPTKPQTSQKKDQK